MKQVIETIVKSLVDAPNEVTITEIGGDKTMIYELRCNAQDVGKIIGKSGKTVGAIRTILSAMASKQGRKALLEVVD
jgi:predicted RNA-binding protein YlqC (UPF0109 family)